VISVGGALSSKNDEGAGLPFSSDEGIYVLRTGLLPAAPALLALPLVLLSASSLVALPLLPAPVPVPTTPNDIERGTESSPASPIGRLEVDYKWVIDRL
jgi:hypothetical protein